jgi:hypothetical protein
MINIRKLALILGVSYVALCAALADGRVVLPPAPLVQQYLNGNPAVTSDHIMQSMILPGLGAFAGFMAGGGAGSLTPASVFATSLYSGNASARTITTGIQADLVWGKNRGQTFSHALVDSVRGVASGALSSDTTAAQSGSPTDISAISSTGFTTASTGVGALNYSNAPIVIWSFAKAAKFFDIVTYTGNGTTQTINHNLGVAPGFIIIKDATAPAFWPVYHKDIVSGSILQLNTTSAVINSVPYYFGNNTTGVSPTTTGFTIGNSGAINNTGDTYIAYLFAHDPTGIIQCGSYTTNSSAIGPAVNLGWQPQYLLLKNSTGTSSWFIYDTTRGLGAGADKRLLADLGSAEVNSGSVLTTTSTGFTDNGAIAGSSTIIYMAIKA